MSDWMTAAGVEYVTMNDSCLSQVFQCVTPAGVIYLHACMTPAGVKFVRMHDSCRSQIFQ